MAGSGYQGFRACIEAVAADIGGGPHVRDAVAEEAARVLRNALCARLGLDAYALPHGTWWTLCEDGDFDAAAEAAQGGPLQLWRGAPLAAAAWRGARLARREGMVHLEGRAHGLMVAMVGSSIAGTRGAGESIQAFLTGEGKTALFGRHLPPSGKPTTVTARSRAAAEASMARLVEGLFGVSFTDIDAGT